MVPPNTLLSPGETRILICDELAPAALEIFARRGFEPEVRTGLKGAELLDAVRKVHAIVVRSATKITREVIEAAEELRVIGRAGVGVDNVDTVAATERGVVVMNTPTGNTTTTGELAIALLLAISRNIAAGDRRVRSGSWNKKGLLGAELTGKRLGVIGLGRIGRVVAERAMGLKMEVVGHDPYLMRTGAGSPISGVDLLDLDSLLATSDFVTLHVPLLDSTRNLLSADRIALMKPGARLINAARGGLVDEAALAAALDDGRLAGAALDVLAEEPPSPEHPLLGRDDVIITPHMGASSHEAQHNVAVGIADQISDFLLEGVAHNSVNAPAVDSETLRAIAPYVILAEKMGSFLSQRTGGPVRKLEVTLGGEIASKDASYLSLSVLVGILNQSELGVNRVNAPLIAKDRGIRVLTNTDGDSHSFQSLVKVRASTQGGEESHLVSGTVFGRAPRFVRVDDLHLDLAPEGTILITTHSDRPGVMGRIGTILGDAKVNIRRVELGASETGKPQFASGFLSLDSEPPAEVMDAIRAVDGIEEVRLVRL
ncbi:MAG: phosphoglycerate dehydrogenase [Planctomycetes bacterium]|nr:phosphoglycerate dehydrogenase [Planctomycetota bacterium]MCB9904318.1 phosphoglycerate dehydrogenase [Planctomycetota bacterium]